MSEQEWRLHISIDPSVHHGDPCIKGTRIPVSLIVGAIADGDSPEQIISSYPQLKPDDVRAALLFAAEAVNRFDFLPLSA